MGLNYAISKGTTLDRLDTLDFVQTDDGSGSNLTNNQGASSYRQGHRRIKIC